MFPNLSGDNKIDNQLDDFLLTTTEPLNFTFKGNNSELIQQQSNSGDDDGVSLYLNGLCTDMYALVMQYLTMEMYFQLCQVSKLHHWFHEIGSLETSSFWKTAVMLRWHVDLRSKANEEGIKL